MSTIEVRLSTPERLPEALASGADVVGLGQEGCLFKLPAERELRDAAEQVRESGLACTVIAPIAWPRTAPQLVRLMRCLVQDGPVTIAVNDTSTFLDLAADVPPTARLVAGLALTRAQPASADLSGERRPEPVLDTASLELMGGEALTGVEVDTDTPLPERDRPWQIRQLLEIAPVGYARSCPTARDHALAPPDCRSSCDIPYEITPNQRWRLNDGHREPLPVATVRPTLQVWGNTVYRPTHHEATVSYRIIDARRHGRGALATAVERARAAHVPAP